MEKNCISGITWMADICAAEKLIHGSLIFGQQKRCFWEADILAAEKVILGWLIFGQQRRWFLSSQGDSCVAYTWVVPKHFLGKHN